MPQDDGDRLTVMGSLNICGKSSTIPRRFMSRRKKRQLRKNMKRLKDNEFLVRPKKRPRCQVGIPVVLAAGCYGN